MLKISPADYVTAVSTHFLNETEAMIVPLILRNVSWIFNHGLMENSNDAKFNEYATDLSIGVIFDTMVTKI